MSAEKILGAALARFAREGYIAASLAEIAEDVGIRKPSIYSHFASKKQLFLDILTGAFAREQECLAKLAEAKDLAALKEYLFAILIRFGADDYLRFWLRAVYLPPVELAADIEKYDAEFASAMDAALALASPLQASPDAQLFTEAYSGIVRAIHAELLYHGLACSRIKAEAMWKVFELALVCPLRPGMLAGTSGTL